MDAYQKYVDNTRETTILTNTRSAVGWDLETYMPPRGLKQRSEQLGLLSAMIHRMIVNPENGKLFEQLESNKSKLTPEQNRDVYLGRIRYDIQTKTPEELVSNLAKQRAISVETWKKAKAANDWKLFLPELKKTVELVRKQGEIWQEVKATSTIYDAMLDYFERGLTAKKVTEVFSGLRDGLVPLTKKCADASKDLDTSFLDKRIPVDIQRRIATDLATIVGYDTTSDSAGGRIDEVEHPFTSGFYDDVRITVKYHDDNLSSMMYAILHEAGHALYEQNLNPEWKYRMLGQAASYGIHESQSRFIENLIGRSTEFISYYLPKLNEFTNGAYKGIDVEHFTKAMNIVNPSLIRIEADEVTYSLHIIIRYEIERDLFSDKIAVDELPQVWNEKYEKYLGIDVPNDTKGVLQDTHWASGYFGYFPSYALGNVYDGMFLEVLDKDLPDWRNDVAEGNLHPPIEWMKTNVHLLSSLYDPAELAEKVTGKKISPKPFLDYLESKYGPLFGF